MPLPLKAAIDTRWDVLTFGEHSVDLVAIGSDTPPSAGKYVLAGVERHFGGQAATAAVAAARQGARSGYVGAFGDDEWARAVTGDLGAHGVDVVSLVRPGARTRTAIVHVAPDGERVIHEYRDPELTLDDWSPLVAAAADTRLLEVDATDVPAAIAATRAARQHGVRTMVDIDRADIMTEQLLEQIDVIIAPAALLTRLAGAPELGRALQALAVHFGAGIVIATMGQEGSLAYAAGREIRTTAFAVEVVDTTGAGDAFRGGFASTWLMGADDVDLETVLRFANATAALNCRSIGAQTGLPTREEVEALVTAASSGRSN